MITELLETDYGRMLVPANDINQTGSLRDTGRAIDHDEIEMLKRIVPQVGGKDCVFLDVGANVGTYTLGLARHVRRVVSIEAQPLLSQMVSGSVALNGLLNVRCLNIAAGRDRGAVEVPQFDYGKPLNFGSIEFGPSQREPLTQDRKHDPDKAEYVHVVPIDALNLCDVGLMKIDVEGWELDVLLGAQKTIRECGPVLYVELLKSDAVAIAEFIKSIGYRMVPMGMNALCLPPHLEFFPGSPQ